MRSRRRSAGAFSCASRLSQSLESPLRLALTGTSPTGTSTASVASVAYATDDNASDDRTANPVTLVRRSRGACEDGSGEPSRRRLSGLNTPDGSIIPQRLKSELCNWEHARRYPRVYRREWRFRRAKNLSTIALALLSSVAGTASGSGPFETDQDKRRHRRDRHRHGPSRRSSNEYGYDLGRVHVNVVNESASPRAWSLRAWGGDRAVERDCTSTGRAQP